MVDKKVWAGLAGLFDPALIQLARSWAEAVPQDSILRSQGFEAVLGAVRGYLETHTEKYPALASVSLEKLTDLTEFLSATLMRGAVSDNKALIQNFLAETAERLKKSDDPKKEAERIQEELALLKEIMGTASQKEDEGPSPFTPALEVLNQKLEGLRNRLTQPKET